VYIFEFDSVSTYLKIVTYKRHIKERCNDIERQHFFENLREKRSLIFYCDMKLLWAREDYVTCCSRKDRSRREWFRAGTGKLRETRKGLENGRCPLCNEEEDAVHIPLKCPETRRLGEDLLSCKWQTINEETAYKKVINCTNIL
jgi:hypothetical protein